MHPCSTSRTLHCGQASDADADGLCGRKFARQGPAPDMTRSCGSPCARHPDSWRRRRRNWAGSYPGAGREVLEGSRPIVPERGGATSRGAASRAWCGRFPGVGLLGGQLWESEEQQINRKAYLRYKKCIETSSVARSEKSPHSFPLELFVFSVVADLVAAEN